MICLCLVLITWKEQLKLLIINFGKMLSKVLHTCGRLMQYYVRKSYILHLYGLNPNLEIPIKREWFQKGINTIADLMGPMYQILSMDQFKEKYQVKTNFLEYNIITIKIKKSLESKEIHYTTNHIREIVC